MFETYNDNSVKGMVGKMEMWPMTSQRLKLTTVHKHSAYKVSMLHIKKADKYSIYCVFPNPITSAPNDMQVNTCMGHVCIIIILYANRLEQEHFNLVMYGVCAPILFWMHN